MSIEFTPPTGYVAIIPQRATVGHGFFSLGQNMNARLATNRVAFRDLTLSNFTLRLVSPALLLCGFATADASANAVWASSLAELSLVDLSPPISPSLSPASSPTNSPSGASLQPAATPRWASSLAELQFGDWNASSVQPSVAKLNGYDDGWGYDVSGVEMISQHWMDYGGGALMNGTVTTSSHHFFNYVTSSVNQILPQNVDLNGIEIILPEATQTVPEPASIALVCAAALPFVIGIRTLRSRRRRMCLIN